MFSLRISLSVLFSMVAVADNIHRIDCGILAPDGSSFRKDYKYFPTAEGWMKLHKMPSTWNDAIVACHLEGAILASPINEGVASALKLVLESTDTPSAFTGVRSMNTQDDFFSIEGVHINEMPVWWACGEPNNLNGGEGCVAMEINGDLKDVNCTDYHSFICYKKQTGRMSMNECGFNAEGYVKVNSTGSCYKVHPAATWHKAVSICAAEGGHLAVIETDEEGEEIKKVTKLKDQEKLHIGFYNLMGRYKTNLEISEWITVDGKILKESGYLRWDQNEPNNIGGDEYCGSVHKTPDYSFKFNDVSCKAVLRFICEIELNKPSA